MATMFIEEFSAAGIAGPGMLPVGVQPSATTQTVSIGGTSAQSSAFGATTRFVRLSTDAVCSYSFGTNPTATTSKPRMGSGQVEYFAVTPGHKIAVISNT